MRRKICYFAVLVFSIFMLVSCSGKSHYTFTSSGLLYSKGSQKISIIVEEDTTTFESSVKKENFKLSTELSGKTISNLTYIDKNTVELVIEGSLDKVNDSEYDYHEIEISNDALKGNSTATVVVKVYNHSPRVLAGSVTYIKSGSSAHAASKYSLPYGEFIEANCTNENITLQNGNGDITISIVEEKLKVDITNFVITDENDRYPYIKISKVCTSFNEDIFIKVGLATFSDIYN